MFRLRIYPGGVNSRFERFICLRAENTSDNSVLSPVELGNFKMRGRGDILEHITEEVKTNNTVWHILGRGGVFSYLERLHGFDHNLSKMFSQGWKWLG